MYGETTFTWEYVCGYETREQRKRRVFRRVYMLTIALCLSCLVAVIIVRFAAMGGLKALTDRLGETEAIPSEETTEPVYVVEEQTFAVAQTAAAKTQEIMLAAVEKEHTPTIYLDPGHGGTDEGCARNGVLEKDINLAIALLVREQLIEQGYDVIMSREADTYIAKEERVKEANESGADIYISIHQNATDEGTGVSGMEVWYEEDGSERDSKRLAQLIRQQTLKSTGLWRGNCAVMRIFM